MIKTIIFFEINNKSNNKINIYLKKNNKDYYEDIKLDFNGQNDYNLDVIPLYKIYIKENNNLIFLLDINRYIDIYNIYYNKFKNLEKINYKYFTNKAFHNNMKHKRLKNMYIQNSLDYIILNRNIRSISLKK